MAFNLLNFLVCTDYCCRANDMVRGMSLLELVTEALALLHILDGDPMLAHLGASLAVRYEIKRRAIQYAH